MTTKHHYLTALGIQCWQSKTASDNIPQPDLQSVKTCVQACTACILHKTRKQTVFGTGNPHAELMLIGEGPGFHEDQQGEPFVGRAGQLLNAMLQAIDLKRDEVYIANIVKCRPPDNRDPTSEEVAECTPFLKKQISFIQPKLIVALGKVAANFLLNTKTTLGKCREQFHQYEHTPLLVTYHPAYLLRSPSDKKKAFHDLQMIQCFLLNGETSNGHLSRSSDKTL